ncbi:hypothetical protein V8C86DRAFT_1418629 [Haematococcus lacustris]
MCFTWSFGACMCAQGLLELMVKVSSSCVPCSTHPFPRSMNLVHRPTGMRASVACLQLMMAILSGHGGELLQVLCFIVHVPCFIEMHGCPCATVKKLLEEIRTVVVHLNRKRFKPVPSSQGSDKWRDTCLNTYDPPALRTDNATLPCVALGGRYDKRVVKAAHIYQRGWDRDELVRQWCTISLYSVT